MMRQKRIPKWPIGGYLASAPDRSKPPDLVVESRMNSVQLATQLRDASFQRSQHQGKASGSDRLSCRASCNL